MTRTIVMLAYLGLLLAYATWQVPIDRFVSSVKRQAKAWTE